MGETYHCLTDCKVVRSEIVVVVVVVVVVGRELGRKSFAVGGGAPTT